MRPALVGLALAVVVGGCRGGDGMAYEELADRTFVSTSMAEGDTAMAPLGGTSLVVRFSSNRSVQANAGCNEMGAKVESLDGRKLHVEKGWTSTAVLCESLQDQEQWLGRLLGAEPDIEYRRGRLVLTAGDRRAEFVEHDVDARALLVGPTWLVESTVRGGEAQPVPGDAQPRLAFDDDGYRSLACPESEGLVEYERGSLRIGSGPVGCTDAEVATIGIETGRFTVQRDGDLVRLRSASGFGLDLRAER
jgi:heat shock protein HslJ